MTERLRKRKLEAGARQKRITRRRFLVGAGATGGLLVGGYLGLQFARPKLADYFEGGSTSPPKTPKDPSVWFEVGKDNSVTMHAPKFEMGQGIHSALAQIAAEELEVDWDKLRVVQASNQRGFEAGAMFTFGSTSVSSMFAPTRQAAATMREVLRLEAAKQLGANPNDVVASRGACMVRGQADKKRSYGEIVAAKVGPWAELKTPPTLKPRTAFTSIGREMPRLDTRQKILGTGGVYAFDARLPGMLYGAVVRPPRFGATLKSVNQAKAQAMPGVQAVVVDISKNFAGVAATTRPQAMRAVAALEAEWLGGSNISQAELEALCSTKRGEGVVIRNRGNTGNNLRGATTEAAYRTPLAAHAHLEPISALVEVRADAVEAWVPTQFTSGDETTLKNLVPGKRVILNGMHMGGSFGRKGSQSAAGEAARLALATGKPVHVAWTRQEEMRHGFFRPPSQTVLQASLAKDGQIIALEQHTASGDILFGVINFPGADVVKNTLGFELGAVSGQFSPYAIPNYLVRSKRVALPVPTGPWRGLGLMPNTFALESFMDELASAAKQDPLQYRLRHLPDDERGKRFKNVLQDVATRSDWTTQTPGRAKGLAISAHGQTVVAMVAEVSVNKQNIGVHRVWVSVDAGLIVNPQNAALQAKGAVVMGLSSTLLEEVTVQDGAVVQSNFDQYRLLRFDQAPESIDVRFLSSGDTPFGMGEPVIGPVPAAVGNAVARLTGQRLRDLPLRLS